MAFCLDMEECPLLTILTECPDMTSRSNVQVLVNFVLKKLVEVEKDYMMDMEKNTIER